MKKLILFFALVFAASNAFAKTEGNYIGVNVQSASSTSHQQYQIDVSNGFGLDYKYAWNFDNLFIAPGILYDNTESTNPSSGNVDILGGLLSGLFGGNTLANINLKDRYGAKFNIGYDVDDRSSFYFTNGLMVTPYNSRVYYINSQTPLGDVSYRSNSFINYSYFYGLGYNLRIFDNWNLNAEWSEYQGHFKVSADDFGPAYVSNNRMTTYRLGVSYRF